MKKNKFSCLLIACLYSSVFFGQSWSLVWEETFSGTNLNDSVWTHDIGSGSQYGLWGWGNGEQQFYQPSNTEVSNGKLKITAQQEPNGLVDSWGNSYYLSSSKIISRDKMEFRYGKVEARVKTINGQGFWPAFWMLPSGGSWPCDGEIDIMEQWGSDYPTNSTTGAAHIGSCPGPSSYNSFNHYSTNGNYADDFHIYSVIWQENYIAWYVDGVKVHSISPSSYSSIPTQHSWPFNSNDWYLIINLAVDQNGPNGNTQFPSSIEVDYIKIYENNGILGCDDPQAINYNSQANVNNGSCEYLITFKVDMNNTSVNYTVPEVNGTFNDWCGSCWPMTDQDGDNIWEKEIVMLEGYYEFKFSADNWSQSESLDPAWGCTNGNSTYTNRTLVVDENRVICPQWGLCTPTCGSNIISNVSEIDVTSNIYPNPSSGLINLNNSEAKNLKILNIYGDKLLEFEKPKKTIDLRNLASGMYIAQYQIGKIIKTQKINILK